MLDTESRWSEALTRNNIKSIICWLESLKAEGDTIPPSFSCWVQRTSEFTKKELITLSFSRCHGLWMFLDRTSFTRVHVLLQRLKNLRTLAQWAKQQLYSAHLWGGVGVPCSVCMEPCSCDVRRSCWSRAHRVLRQHIWLGQLVQWWGIMGLLPKFPEAQEVKRIAQMWREMEHSHRRACPDTPGREEDTERMRCSSLIQGLVMHLHRQHGCVWTSGDGADHFYPPPNLQALLKLVLMAPIDNTSVQAIFMYFIQDVASFLQCKDNLLQSFCHAFYVPAAFSQQVKAFWMFDHGHIKASMELLLSPRARPPSLSWQHHCIIHCLLSRKQPQLAFRYLHWTRPAIQTPEDAKLCADVLLQCSCVSDSWTLLKKGHADSDHVVVVDFLRACEGLSLCAEALKYIPAGYHEDGEHSLVEAKDLLLSENECCERPPCPLSARLYQAQRATGVSSDHLVRLVRKAVMEVRKPPPRTRELVWPQPAEQRADSTDMCQSVQALHRLSLSPATLDLAEETEHMMHAEEPEWEAPVIHHLHLDRRNLVSPPEDLRSWSASSITSASSPPPLKPDPTYVYERTLTLQRISSLLTDGENQSSDEEEEEEEEEDDEEESETLTTTDGSQSCSELVQTPDGARGSDSRSKVSNPSPAELMLSAEEEDVFPGEEDFSFMGLSGPYTDEHLSNTRLDVQSQADLNTDSQSVPLLPDLEQRSSCDGVCSASANQDHRSGRIASPATAPSHCVLERKAQQKAHKLHRQDKLAFSHDLSCEASETTQDLLTDPHLNLEEPPPSGQRSSVLSTTCSITPTHAESTSPALVPDSACSIGTTPAPPPTLCTNEGKTDGACDSGTSAWSDRGGDQGRDPLSAAEPGEASPGTAGDRRPSFVLSASYTCRLGNFMDFNTTQKHTGRDGRQAEKEEAAGWKVSQGAIRSGRTGARRGKRFKRT